MKVIQIIMIIIGAIVAACGLCAVAWWLWKLECRSWARDIRRVTQELCDEVDSIFPGQRTVSQQELETAVKKDFGLK